MKDELEGAGEETEDDIRPAEFSLLLFLLLFLVVAGIDLPASDSLCIRIPVTHPRIRRGSLEFLDTCSLLPLPTRIRSHIVCILSAPTLPISHSVRILLT